MELVRELASYRPDGPRRIGARRSMAGAVALLHLAAVWALLQLPQTRRTATEAAPLLVRLVGEAAATSVDAGPVLAPAPSPRPAAPAAAIPSITVADAAPAPTPALADAAAASPAVHITPPAAVASALESASTAPPPAATPPAQPAASAPAPRTLTASAVQYLRPPELAYPSASRRAQEQGEVQVRVLVDALGLPRQLQLLRSSGHARLDEAALAAVRATRFRPHTENGTPQPFWVVVPLVFELDG